MQRKTLVLALAVICSTSAGASLAQTTSERAPSEADQAQTLDRLVVVGEYGAANAVTGTKTDTPVLKVPQSVAVVGSRLLEERRPATLGDALFNVSGAVDTGSRRGFDNFVLRGFTASGSVYLDGLRVERGNFNVQQKPFGLERIEVLKGPGSVLFGQGSLGGIVNQVSKQPESERAIEVELGGGSYGTRHAAIDATGALGTSGTLTARLLGLYRELGDEVDFNDKERIYLSPGLRWEAGGTSLTVRANYTRDRHEGTYVGLPVQGTILPNPSGPLDRRRYIGEAAYDGVEIERVQIGYEFEHRFNDTWLIRQNARYTDSDVMSSATFSQGLDPTERLVRRGTARFTLLDHSTAVDTQLHARTEGASYRNTFLVGVDALFQNVDSTFGFGSFAPLDLYDPVYGAQRSPLAPIQDYRRGDDLYGLYAQNQLELGERLTLVGGVRYDSSRTDNTNRLAGATRRQSDSDITVRAGAVYSLTPGVGVFASYSEAFNPNFGVDAAGNPFSAETGEQMELGIKTDLADGRIRTTTAIYNLVRDNVLVPFPQFPGTQVQTGQQRSRGLEADVAFDITDAWSLTGAYAYTDVEVRKDTNPALLGNRPVNVPRHQASLWSSYVVPVGRGMLTLGAGARHVTGREGTLPNTYALPDYTVMDAVVGYWQDSWRVQLNADNLTDRAYISSASPTGASSVMYGVSRQLRATFAYTF
jgi:iron complex outermembrane recepter protein